MMDAYLWGEKLKEMLNEAIGLHDVSQADFLSQMIISAFDEGAIETVQYNLDAHLGYDPDYDAQENEYDDDPSDDDFDEFEDENEAIARMEMEAEIVFDGDIDEHDPDDQPWGDEDDYFNAAE